MRGQKYTPIKYPELEKVYSKTELDDLLRQAFDGIAAVQSHLDEEIDLLEQLCDGVVPEGCQPETWVWVSKLPLGRLTENVAKLMFFGGFRIGFQRGSTAARELPPRDAVVKFILNNPEVTSRERICAKLDEAGIRSPWDAKLTHGERGWEDALKRFKGAVYTYISKRERKAEDLRQAAKWQRYFKHRRARKQS